MFQNAHLSSPYQDTPGDAHLENHREPAYFSQELQREQNLQNSSCLLTIYSWTRI